MNYKTIISFALTYAVGLAIAAEPGDISFTSVESVRQARDDLASRGIAAFMKDAWAQGVAAPGIHSKYWIDRFTRGKPELAALETAYRDFGREVARQVNLVAIDTFRHPDRLAEADRLVWMLNFAEWIGRAGKFDNYRIAARAEDAATIPLLRVIIDMDVSEKLIEGQLARFSTTQSSAPVRAEILYEESNGVLDVRKLASKAKGLEDGFLDEWRSKQRWAYWHFGRKLLQYSENIERMKSEKDKYAFFADDVPFGRYCSPDRWDLKHHLTVCIYHSEAYFIRPIKSVFKFRKIGGKFSKVAVPAGMRECDAYSSWYREKYEWMEQHGVNPSSVGAYFLSCILNTYADMETRELRENSERMECAKKGDRCGPIPLEEAK